MLDYLFGGLIIALLALFIYMTIEPILYNNTKMRSMPKEKLFSEISKTAEKNEAQSWIVEMNKQEYTRLNHASNIEDVPYRIKGNLDNAVMILTNYGKNNLLDHCYYRAIDGWHMTRDFTEIFRECVCNNEYLYLREETTA